MSSKSKKYGTSEDGGKKGGKKGDKKGDKKKHIKAAKPSHIPGFKPKTEQRSSLFSGKYDNTEEQEEDVEENKADDEEKDLDRYNHYNPRVEELVIKGFLAFCFYGISTFCLFYCQPNYNAEKGYETHWKNFMFGLCQILWIPKLYQTTLGMFTFNAIYFGRIEHELATRRPIWRVLLMAIGLSFVVPFQVPLGLLYLPITYGCRFRDRHKFLILLVGWLDFVQTIVLIPLSYVVIYATDSTEDVFLNTVVVQVFATLDDEFVMDLIGGPEVKQDALEAYTDEVYMDENGNLTEEKANKDRSKSLADFAFHWA